MCVLRSFLSFLALANHSATIYGHAQYMMIEGCRFEWEYVGKSEKLIADYCISLTSSILLCL